MVDTLNIMFLTIFSRLFPASGVYLSNKTMSETELSESGVQIVLTESWALEFKSEICC